MTLKTKVWGKKKKGKKKSRLLGEVMHTKLKI